MLNNVIASLSGAGAPVATTAYESIATVTVGAGGSGSVSFTSIANTWTHLQLRFIVRTTASVNTDYINLQFNSDGLNNYSTHLLNGDGASASAGAYTSQPAGYLERFPANNAGANIFGAGVLDILDYANTNKYKTVRVLSGVDYIASGVSGVYLTSHLWFKAGSGVVSDAINSITLTPASSSFAQYSQFALYGIKGS